MAGSGGASGGNDPNPVEQLGEDLGDGLGVSGDPLGDLLEVPGQVVDDLLGCCTP